MNTGYSTHFFREEMGFTQKEMADYFEMSLATIQNWDTRKNMPVYVWNMLKEIIKQKTMKEQFYADLHAEMRR